jgi:putative membrane protein
LLIEIIIFLLLGIAAGTACGLLPGLHVNNVGAMMLSAMAILGLEPVSFAVFLVAMATTQTFIDFIPSIFLGVPDEGTVLSMLPAHRLLLQGKGMEAVRLTGLASLYGVLVSLAILPIAFVLVPMAYSMIRASIVPVLGFSIIFLILRERKAEKILWAMLSFLLAGYLGYTCLNLNALSTSQVFLPLFSGMFGLSTLLTGIQAGSKFYPQDLEAELEISSKGMWRSSFLGGVGGLIVGLLPAMSPSQIGIVFQEIQSFREKGRKLANAGKKAAEELKLRQFMAIVGSLNTADAMFSIFSLYLMNNPRSGISVILQDLFGQIDFCLLALLAGVMLASGVIAYKIHIFIGKKFSTLAGSLDFRKLSAMGFIFVFVMVFSMSGALGILIAIVSMCVGLIPALTGVSRTHCMGSLLLPTLLFFLGI